MKTILIIVVSGVLLQTVLSQTIVEKDYKKYFDSCNVKGCFVLFNQADNEFVRYNSNLCDTGYIPASTFKIPHSLIALEEGIVHDTNQIFKWDGKEWANKLWNQDQTLITAMKYSCIWVYFDFAKQIGINKYYEYVKSFDYGNENLTGPPTRFWLTGALRISANQQIDFLRKFYNYELSSSKQSIETVKDLIILEQTNSYKLSGKTGGGNVSDNEYIMWLVGYIEIDNKPYFYAMNYKTNDFSKTLNARYEITKNILRELKLIE